MDISSMTPDAIPALSTVLSTAELKNEVSFALMSQALDTVEEAGDAMIDMMRHSMELSVNPGVGANIDICV